MKNYFASKAGIGMLELLVGGTASVFMVLLVIGGYASLMKFQAGLSSQRKLQGELARAFKDVMKVGRTAQSCKRVVESTGKANPPPKIQAWLECRVDMNHPPTPAVADDVTFRFGMNDDQFSWLKMMNGESVAYARYEGVSAFDICDDARMQDIQNPCSASQVDINKRHLANLALPPFPTPSNHFFRFLLEGYAKDGTKKTIQSAFTVRHPSSDGLLYEWVGIEK